MAASRDEVREPRGSALTALEVRAWTGLLRTHARLSRSFDARLREAHGLSLSEFDVLMQLAAAPRRRLTMSRLAELVLVTPSGMTRAVERLERDGLVAREPCARDRRVCHCVLRHAGATRLRRARATHLEHVRRSFLDLCSEDELAVLARVWERATGISPARSTE